jgi:hypothetical protein
MIVTYLPPEMFLGYDSITGVCHHLCDAARRIPPLPSLVVSAATTSSSSVSLVARALRKYPQTIHLTCDSLMHPHDYQQLLAMNTLQSIEIYQVHYQCPAFLFC